MARPTCFLEVSIGEEPVGRLTIELFTDHTPITCENFRQFCTGEHNGMSYAGSPFHRVVNEFMIQGGDVTAGDGTSTVSIYGNEFDDENLAWRDVDASGLVCSANRGPGTNGSQFFITLVACPHLKGKHTIFGRLVAGDNTLKRIASVAVDKDDRPREPVLISRCGELEKPKKAPPPHPPPAIATTSSPTRGRRRSGPDSAISPETPGPDPTCSQPIPRTRRQSDNAIDEGLRGRPRKRSHSHSHSHSRSRALAHHTEESDDGHDSSTAYQHKRKRSASPRRAGGADYPRERRRRSLSSQYHNHAREDSERSRPHHARQAEGHFERRREYRPQGDSYRPQGDSYRPARDRDRWVERDRRPEYGRLGGCRDDGYDPPVKFKGRGIMKYREPGRLG